MVLQVAIYLISFNRILFRFLKVQAGNSVLIRNMNRVSCGVFNYKHTTPLSTLI